MLEDAYLSLARRRDGARLESANHGTEGTQNLWDKVLRTEGTGRTFIKVTERQDGSPQDLNHTTCSGWSGFFWDGLIHLRGFHSTMTSSVCRDILSADTRELT